MRRNLTLSSIALIALCGCTSSRLDTLQVLQDDYPRAFFFRGCEGWSARRNADWNEWDGRYSRLMGIMGKCLDEEVLGREAHNPEWFSRFKAAHPEQAVLLHFNGNARDPRHGTEKYFAGHWVYRRAVMIVGDVPAETGQSVIRVEDTGDFRVNSGRYRTSNDDIALFGVTPEGRHDWNRCEQVRLLAVDREQRTITVERGCYGTTPLAFKAGESRAAAHAVEGPWGKTNNLLWFYNFATHSPRDAEGRSCADRLVDDLAGWFGAGGKLEVFDGLEFDVLHHVTEGDTDGDGLEDDGVRDGINAYGIGVHNFARQLRERLGRDTIIQADGALGPGGVRSQRANGIFNGIESEGWPNLRDWDFDDWSGGINRHNFWQRNAFAPAFSYINHKWTEPVPGQPGVTRHPEVPFSRHRLALAGAQFTDAVVTFAFAPPQAKGRGTGVWDELVCGAEGRPGWLGRARGGTLSLARTTPDLLADADIARRIAGDVSVTPAEGGVLIAAREPDCGTLTFRVQDVPAAGRDLTLFVDMLALPRDGYPADMPRFAAVAVEGGCMTLMEALADDSCGEALRGGRERAIDSASGAMVRFRAAEKIGDEIMAAYAVHPPFQAVKGYVFWSREVTLPQRDYDLRFSLGMSAKAPERSDGLWFKIFVAEVRDGAPGEFKQVFEQSTRAHAWIPCSVPLSPWAGKKVILKFVADCGPQNNATTDQGYWGDVRLVRSGVGDAEITPTRSYMTWLGTKPFEASFYYRDIRSRSVDLVFSVEGGAPVLLRSVAAHAAPDARCRVFENGVVLGNPGHAPQTFDLERIAPGMRLRRIKATELQDAEVNSGEAVGASVTLGALDGLFLLRE
jgi:hypothetical protein